MRCLKSHCKYYFDSDIYSICNLSNKPIIYDCVGLEEIIPQKEELLCEIGKLLKEYDKLIELENKIMGDKL